MPNIRWKSVGRVLLAAAFAYIGAYLVGPDHVIKSYTQWGYPPWAHFVAGAAFLSTAILLPFHRTRWVGAAVACCVLAAADASCWLHGDYAHAIQGPPIIALIAWLVLDRSPPRLCENSNEARSVSARPPAARYPI
jgi:hypothetical protein